MNSRPTTVLGFMAVKLCVCPGLMIEAGCQFLSVCMFSPASACAFFSTLYLCIA